MGILNENKDMVFSVIDLKDDNGVQVLTKNKQYTILSENVESNGILIQCDNGDNRIIHTCCFTNYIE